MTTMMSTRPLWGWLGPKSVEWVVTALPLIAQRDSIDRHLLVKDGTWTCYLIKAEEASEHPWRGHKGYDWSGRWFHGIELGLDLEQHQGKRDLFSSCKLTTIHFVNRNLKRNLASPFTRPQTPRMMST